MGIRLWRHRYKAFRVALVGLTAKYQSSFLGNAVTTVAFEEIRRRTRTRGLDELVAGWILEQNEAMRRPLESIGFHHTMTYNLYEKALDSVCGKRAQR